MEEYVRVRFAQCTFEALIKALDDAPTSAPAPVPAPNSSSENHSVSYPISHFGSEVPLPIRLLFSACKFGDHERVKSLLKDKKVDPNMLFPFPFQETPLVRACLEGHPKVVEVLLADPRIDPNKGDKYGHSPLGSAAYQLHGFKMARLLLQHPKTNPNHQDPFTKYTPLASACFDGNLKMIELLLKDPRVDPTIISPNGTSAFSVSCLKNRLDSVKKLLLWTGTQASPPFTVDSNPFFLEKKRNVAENSSYWKPHQTGYQIAKDNNYAEIVDLLEEYQKHPQEVLERLKNEV